MELDVDDLLEELGHQEQALCDAVNEATALTVAPLEDADLAELGRHNRGLAGYQWQPYLHASRFRVAFLAKAIRDLGATKGRVLDQGAFFGNFSLALHRLGYEVTASDYYTETAASLDPWREILVRSGIEVVDSGKTSAPLPFVDGSFDVILSMGVIEHIPSTPRRHLLELARCLAPGGLLVIETPNLAYQPKRDLLAAGKSVYPRIDLQFDSAIPFSGHHREFTADEVEWMLERVGLRVVHTGFFDFSYRCLTTLDEAERGRVERRRADPSTQEIILCCATRD